MKYLAGIFLAGLGLLTMASDLLGLPGLKGFGAATAASPAPKVFSAVQGYETFSTRFFLEWTDRQGQVQALELTPETCARIAGPYNRRNIYGAMVSYGPVLSSGPQTERMFWGVARYGVTGDAPLLRELGVDPEQVVGAMALVYQPRTGADMGDLPTRIEVMIP
ncbi:MAG: hypothetical protein ACI9D0_000889 [Bacteroidia bacterium]|jgi:hypothetical protein